MVYGMQIRTVYDLESLANKMTLQEVARFARTVTSGSLSAPAGLTDANCIAICEPKDGNKHVAVTIDGSGTVFWDDPPTTPLTTNFDIVVLRFG